MLYIHGIFGFGIGIFSATCPQFAPEYSFSPVFRAVAKRVCGLQDVSLIGSDTCFQCYEEGLCVLGGVTVSTIGPSSEVDVFDSRIFSQCIRLYCYKLG